MVLYTAVGGLKATFLTDYLHTTIALILIIYFTLAVLTNSAVGGLSGLYDKVVATAGENYISGNYEGSLLTFKSKGAIIWGLILKFGNLALVVMVRRNSLPQYERSKQVHYANVGLIGHRILAKVLCDGGPRHSPWIQHCCDRRIWDSMGSRNGYRADSPRNPQHAYLSNLPWRTHFD